VVHWGVALKGPFGNEFLPLSRPQGMMMDVLKYELRVVYVSPSWAALHPPPSAHTVPRRIELPLGAYCGRVSSNALLLKGNGRIENTSARPITPVRSGSAAYLNTFK